MNHADDLGGLPPRMQPPFGGSTPGDGFRNDLRSYAWGLLLAIVLTAVPFALVHAHALPTSSLWLAIGLFALVQGVVHFRCFLHINPPHEHLDEALLVAFTVIILIMMAGGTVWILGNLHSRMY
ncbi:MAG TPA: cytochrome C oxidase subunit IV family protein [Acetobacteraceae bacterium]|nr:cytochrome C oxidase subunit IV family protein [Acetobacteraceae bacterium]